MLVKLTDKARKKGFYPPSMNGVMLLGARVDRLRHCGPLATFDVLCEDNQFRVAEAIDLEVVS